MTQSSPENAHDRLAPAGSVEEFAGIGEPPGRLVRSFVLTSRALWELLRCDLVSALFGFKGIYRGLARHESFGMPVSLELENSIRRAMLQATCLYWKRVRCLQMAVATTRLMRSYRINAELVIGCRLTPLLAHAWVEVEGRVVTGSGGYRERLHVLDRAS